MIDTDQISTSADEPGLVIRHVDKSKADEGFDASKGEYVDMFEAGIIDGTLKMSAKSDIPARQPAIAFCNKGVPSKVPLAKALLPSASRTEKWVCSPLPA